MAIVGAIASVIVALLILAAVAIGVRSIPDINRYLRIRRM